MKIGLSGDALGMLMVLMAVFAVISVFVICYIAKKRGVDITTKRFQLRLGLSIGIVCLVPICLTDITLWNKIWICLLALAVGVGNFFATDRMGKRLREYLGLDKKGKGEKK